MGRAPWTSQGAKNNGWDGGYDPNQLKVFKGTVSVKLPSLQIHNGTL